MLHLNSSVLLATDGRYYSLVPKLDFTMFRVFVTFMRNENFEMIMYINFEPCNYKHDSWLVLWAHDGHGRQEYLNFVYLLFYADDKFWRAWEGDKRRRIRCQFIAIVSWEGKNMASKLVKGLDFLQEKSSFWNPQRLCSYSKIYLVLFSYNFAVHTVCDLTAYFWLAELRWNFCCPCDAEYLSMIVNADWTTRLSQCTILTNTRSKWSKVLCTLIMF